MSANPRDLHLPPPAKARVVGAYAHAALDTATAAGVSATQLGYADGLPAELPVADYIALLDRAALLSADACFGLHVGERMRPSTFATYSHVVLSSATFGEAVVQTRRFEGLAHDLGRTELLVEGDVGIYRWHCPWLERWPSRHLPESVLAGILSFANWLACTRLPMLAIRFPHTADAAADPAEYTRIFSAPVMFGATVTEARFPAATLDIAIPNADRSLFPVVERHAALALQAREQAVQGEGIVHEVRQCLMAQLARDQVRLSDVAESLGLPVRTLQRRLREADSSYARLLDATRRELAERYLRDPALSLTEIAFLLGFHEQSSFNHAFRGWHACSPQQWRAQQLA